MVHAWFFRGLFSNFANVLSGHENTCELSVASNLALSQLSIDEFFLL